MNQKQKVLKYINDYGSITSWEAYSDLGIMQLGARIDGLQKDGYSFKKEWEQKLVTLLQSGKNLLVLELMDKLLII